MARVTLKSLLKKKKETATVMAQLAEVLDSGLAVEDVSGTLLLGNTNEHPSERFPVEIEGEVLGWVIGSRRAKAVADLISHLAGKEAEKKTLGQEVLGLYREINLIYNFSEELAAALDLARVAKIAVEEAGQMITSSGGAIFLLREASGALEIVSSFGEAFQSTNSFHLGEGLIGEIAANGNAEIINDLASDARRLEAESSVSSVICAPLKVKKRVLGVIVLVSATPVSYTAADLKLLTTLAVQTASAVESALLHEKAVYDAKVREREKAKMALLEAENNRKSQELEEARQLQLSMLPRDIPRLPNVEIAVHMATATEVGGDYYDFHTDDDGTLTVVLGDATGHGLKAGTMVTTAKSLFSTLAGNPDIPTIFNEMNRSIKSMRLSLLSMCLTMVKIRGKCATMSSAGIPPALIYRSFSESVEEISIGGTPLGAMARFPYRQKTVELQRGDTILLMSDGFPELMNDKEEMLDYPRTQSAFMESAKESPKKIIEHLNATVARWAKGRPQDDDITFVVLKING